MPAKRTENPSSPDPAKLRAIFGANLRQLSGQFRSVAGLCRELGINRTQFNRYLSGESFPRPDVLHRICSFFGVDARILLEPVGNIDRNGSDVLNHPEIAEFIGKGALSVSEDMFPSGFYRFSRPSFLDNDRFVIGLVYVYRRDLHTFIRGFEAREAMRQQGLPTTSAMREFRGIAMLQEDGIAALIARRGSTTCSFNFLSRVASFQGNYYEGYATRTVRETLTGRRAARMVYEHLGRKTGPVLETARVCGLHRLEDVPAFHHKFLRIGEPFN